MAVYNHQKLKIFRDYVLNDPDALGFGAILAAIPEYVEELSTEQYSALQLRDQGSYDDGRVAWRRAVDTQWSVFETLFAADVFLDPSTTISAQDLYELIDDDEGDDLVGTNRQALTDILQVASGRSINIRAGSKARRRLLAAFPSGSTTRNRLLAAFGDRTQRRSESLQLTPPYIGIFETIVRGF